MTPEERAAVLGITRLPDGTRSLSLDRFRQVTRIDDPRSWAMAELLGALEHEDAEDVELAMLVDAAFGMDERWVVPLVRVLHSEWTVSYEDAAYALGLLRDARGIPALVRAAHWVPEYLDFDESMALAVKAIHALDQIPGPEAGTALRQLLDHEDRTLRPRVARVLAGRHATQS